MGKYARRQEGLSMASMRGELPTILRSPFAQGRLLFRDAFHEGIEGISKKLDAIILQLLSYFTKVNPRLMQTIEGTSRLFYILLKARSNDAMVSKCRDGSWRH